MTVPVEVGSNEESQSGVETTPAVSTRSPRPRFRPFWLTPVLALIALTAWLFASPFGSSPDDDFHLASVWCAQSGATEACETTGTVGERLVATAITQGAHCFAGFPKITPACAESVLALDPSEKSLTERGNFGGNYPPVYYLAMSAFAGDDLISSALVMRFVNVLLFVSITTVLFLLLPQRRRPTLLWAWTLTIAPLGLFLIASNNPSSWAITAVGSAWLALLGYFETRGWRKWSLAALFVLTALMASGARGDAAIYIVVGVGIVLVLKVARTREFWLKALLPAAVAVGAVAFYFSSLQSTVVVSGLKNVNAPPPEASPLGLLMSNLVNVPSLWAGVFGTWKLGWFDTSMPALVGYAGIAVFVAVTFIGLRMMNLRKALMLAALGAVLWLLPVYILQQSMDLVGVQVQPRYILPLVVMFAGLAVLQVGGRRFSLTLTQRGVVIVALSVSQALALYYNLRRYVVAPETSSWNLDAHPSWWWDVPFSPMSVWIVGSVASAACIALVVREIGRPNAIA